MHVNEIIRQTSPDRTHIIATIKILERGQLITRHKRIRRGKKVMMQLTEVGQELVDISRSLKQWKEAFLELNKAYEEKIPDGNYKVTYVMHTSETRIVDAIICRSLQLHKFHLHEIAKSILYDVIKDAAAFQLSLILEGLNIGSDIQEDLLGNINDSRSDFPKVIYKEVKDALISQVSLLKPSRGIIEEYIKSIKHEGLSIYPPDKCLLDAYEEYLSRLS
jgi:DNA-binding MarR family transcriptional regulator